MTSKVKYILDKYNIKYEEINVQDTPWSDSIKLALSMHTGYQSFPNIYFGHEHIGGLDDLQPVFDCED
jgi:glutaredoxin